MKQVTNLGTWLSSRSNLYTNIIMQKLGIFHHESFQRYQRRELIHRNEQLPDIENLAKFSLPTRPEGCNRSNRQTGKHESFSWNQISYNQGIRTAKPNNTNFHVTTDPIGKAIYELQDLRQRERKNKGTPVSKFKSFYYSIFY